jgi:putative tryptophan/tyrosine transport system substrate-binding protein
MLSPDTGCDMRRREFLGALGGAAAWPGLAFTQQSERVRRIGVLMDASQDERSRPRLAAFVQGLMDLGWVEGRNVQFEIRWGANTFEKSRILAREFLALAPEVVLTSGSPATAAMRHASATIPTVFVLVTDPMGAGFVDSLARPGSNVTGFTLFEYSIAVAGVAQRNRAGYQPCCRSA